MKKKRTHRSFAGHIDSLTRNLIVVLGIPVLVSLFMMLFFSMQYTEAIRRMETIAALKPLIGEEIPEAVWNVVSGRVSMEESEAGDKISQAVSVIERVGARAAEDNQLELIIAGRTMGTMSAYVDQIRENIANGVAVVENEKVLAEIRDVAELVVSMLNDYITEEIRSTGVMTDRLQKVVMLAAGVELILVALTLLQTQRARKQTARFVREPIEKLESVTRKLAEGDMSARLPLTQVEDLWNLTGQVNIMADNLEEMMRQRVDDERKLKKAELRTLQAQINPHFLYNTLDAIVWKAEAGEEEEVIGLTRALSDFFRISLSSGADWISITQEKKHIAGYLSIQKTRYRDILNYEIDIPDEFGSYYILKLLLQPLVENALYHGIKFRRGGGLISVSARKEEEDLIFTVRDTGRGMDAETLKRLRERLEAGEPTHEKGSNGYGLVNVDLRIRLYYNQADGLHIESGPEGTTVSFRVPCRKEAES